MILAELEHTNVKPILYVDMDGVLADFYGPFNKMAGVNSWKDASKDTVSQVLKDISNKKDFWINLDVLPGVPKLLDAIKKLFNGQYKILSKAVTQKKQWVQSNLTLKPNEVIIMPATADKGIYAKQKDGTSNILIDDFGYNIKKWQSSGGIGIQHTDTTVNSTIQKLKANIQ